MAKWSDLLKEASAQGIGYDPLPAGTYDVQIIKSAHKISQSGKSMFEVEMKVLNGPHANRHLWNRFVVSPENPKALSYFFSHMRALGLTTEFFSAGPSDEQVASALMDRCCRVEVAQTTYNDSIRNEVKKVMAPEGGVAPATSVTATSADVPVMPTATATPTPAPAPAPAPTPAPTPAPELATPVTAAQESTPMPTAAAAPTPVVPF